MTTATKNKSELESLPTTIRPFENPIPFVETFKWDDLNATFTADSYTEWMESALPIIKTLNPTNQITAKSEGMKLGDKIFYLRPFPLWHYDSGPFGFGKMRPCRSKLGVWRGETERSVCFDGVVNIPVLSDSKMNPWMSLTPNEAFTLRGQIRRTKNNTAIAGLGLGWVARKVLERKQVKKVTIYEKNQDLIDYFGKSLVDDFGDRVSIVCCNAYDVDWLQHDVGIWDIWQSLGDASWDKKYSEIRKQMYAAGKVCVGWGEGINR